MGKEMNMEKQHRQFVIGMAGHIDHGKTALVQALTGINTDRLKEEQERGITVDLGFAHFSENATIIDVPGHERLIKNMVAGVSTIDLVLFVVAADDGIMPQTREHLDIVNLLGIRNGIFVITKIDLVEEDWLGLVEEDLKELLNNYGFSRAPILKISAVTGQGIAEVRQVLQENLKKIQPRRDDDIFRLPIDRVFSKAGFGTVITGSVLSGSVQAGDVVEILPEKIQARVRGVQSHDHTVGEVKAGYRAALNLAGVDNEQLYRGQVITPPGIYQPVELLNARITVLPASPAAIRNQMRLRLHLHTIEVFARVLLPESKALPPGESGYVQFRLEKMIYASFRDRFVIRQYSPQITLGGGVVLQVNPPRYRKKFHEQFLATLHRLESEDAADRVQAAFPAIFVHPLTARQVQVSCGLSAEETGKIVAKLQADGELYKVMRGKETYFYAKNQVLKILENIQAILGNYHREYPGRLGLAEKELFSQVGNRYPTDAVQLAVQLGVESHRLKKNERLLALVEFESRLSGKQQDRLERLEEIYRQSGFNPPLNQKIMEQIGISEKEFREFVNILRQQERLIFVDQRFYFHADAIRKAIGVVRGYFTKNENLTVPQFKDLIGSTRKFAIPLLTYLDNRGFTERRGDVRVKGTKLSE